MDGGMNPTLATRCKWRQQQPYWRIHPPGPFVVDSAPPTALAVLLSSNGGGLGVGADPSPGPLRLVIPAVPPEPVIAAEPAPVLVPLSPQLPLPSLAAPGHEPALSLELVVERAAPVIGQGAAPADLSQGLAKPDWLGMLVWLALVVIDAGLALAEVLQRLPAAPAKWDRGAIQSRQGSRLPSLGRLRLRQPLGF